MKREMIAGRLSDSGYTDKVTGTVSDEKVLFGSFVTGTYEDGNLIVSLGGNTPIGMIVTLDQAVQYAYKGGCVTVLRNGRAYALLEKDYEVKPGTQALISANGILSKSGTEATNITVIGEPCLFNDEFDTVEVQINPVSPNNKKDGGKA